VAAMANRRAMHNRALHDSLAAFVEEAARQLADEVSGGAEVPFELMEANPPTRSSAPLYCYRPLTGRFIGERIGMLGRLPSYPAAIQGLVALPDLPGYLQVRGKRPPGPDSRSQADAALQAFLTAVWSEATDFVFDEQRFEMSYAELEAAAYDGCTLSVVIAPVEGLVIESDEVPLGEGLALVRAGTLRDAPGDLGEDELTTVAVLALEGAQGDERVLEGAGRRLRRLQTALRLWDDAEPSLGPTAWGRTDGSAWFAVPLATGIRRPSGDCLLTAEEEDALRAFCSLVSRRTPRAGELAWALRRFELGCERASAVEALTDWLLAGRALLAEPDQPGYDRLPERMAAICALPEDRGDAERRLRSAISLERAAVAGFVRPEPDVEELIAGLGANLRAILRDVLCGHLEPALRRVADGLLATEPAEPAGAL
jgi:hypothetical protein